ncbi:hypothetical protein MNB_SUP05-13-320 [hydrothermal vent metagenome]|uniref:Uncharacterized protein n=1 Tax=hydrothermal vent metagenome TaxID=652676 RepID=A0A1W1DGV2_9ZZZZ
MGMNLDKEVSELHKLDTCVIHHFEKSFGSMVLNLDHHLHL